LHPPQPVVSSCPHPSSSSSSSPLTHRRCPRHFRPPHKQLLVRLGVASYCPPFSPLACFVSSSPWSPRRSPSPSLSLVVLAAAIVIPSSSTLLSPRPCCCLSCHPRCSWCRCRRCPVSCVVVPPIVVIPRCRHPLPSLSTHTLPCEQRLAMVVVGAGHRLSLSLALCRPIVVRI
jgi:hypothetical protein